jgi:hypothetical protein
MRRYNIAPCNINKELETKTDYLVWLLSQTINTINSLPIDGRERGDLVSMYMANLLNGISDDDIPRQIYDQTIGRSI